MSEADGGSDLTTGHSGFYLFLSQLPVNPLRCEYFNEHRLLVSYVPKCLLDTKNETHRAPCLITMETAWEEVPLLWVELMWSFFNRLPPTGCYHYYYYLPLPLAQVLVPLLLLLQLLLKQNYSYYYLPLPLAQVLVPLLRITRIRII